MEKYIGMTGEMCKSALLVIVLISACNGADLGYKSSESGNVEKNISDNHLYCSIDKNEYNQYRLQDQDNYGTRFDSESKIRINCSNVEGQNFPLDLTQDGYLYLNGKYFAPNEFCILPESNSAKLCPHRVPVTWRKCCSLNQVIDSKHLNTCINSTQPFRPQVEGTLESFSVMNATLKEFSCPEGFHTKKLSDSICSGRSQTRFRLSTNGTILQEVAKGIYLRASQWTELDNGNHHYCVDGVINPASNCETLKQNQQQEHPPGEINTSNRNFCHDSFPRPQKDEQSGMPSVVYICVPDQHPDEEDYNQTRLLAVIWIFTCPLLFGAALVNSFVIQKNVHGWILTCYLFSMIILNILSVMYLFDPAVTHEGCRPLDFSVKFMYMSTLCWMTSINFGLCKTFRYTLPQPVGLRRFVLSTIFSLGFPAVSIFVAYIVAYWGTDETCKLEYCLLFSYTTIPYYSVPIFLMVLGNFAIFIKTVYSIATLRKETKDILRKEAQDHLNSFTLFAKLFLLTGAIWPLRLALFALQFHNLYLSWGGVILEMVFSIPEVAFPIIIFHHSEFIKWSWDKIPRISRFIQKLDPLFHSPVRK